MCTLCAQVPPLADRPRGIPARVFPARACCAVVSNATPATPRRAVPRNRRRAPAARPPSRCACRNRANEPPLRIEARPCSRPPSAAALPASVGCGSRTTPPLCASVCSVPPPAGRTSRTRARRQPSRQTAVCRSPVPVPCKGFDDYPPLAALTALFRSPAHALLAPCAPATRAVLSRLPPTARPAPTATLRRQPRCVCSTLCHGHVRPWHCHACKPLSPSRPPLRACGRLPWPLMNRLRWPASACGEGLMTPASPPSVLCAFVFHIKPQ